MAEWYEDGKQLKACRKRLGLTQARLAKLAGVSQSLITAVERGVEEMATRDTRARIANVLVQMNYDRIVEMSATPNEKVKRLKVDLASARKQLAFFRALSEKQQGQIETLEKRIDALMDILHLETKKALTDNEKKEKIAALGLEERSQAEEEFRSELAAHHERAKKR